MISPGKQGAAKAVDFHLDELADIVELVLVLNAATLRPVHVRHRHKVEVAQLEDGRDYLERGDKLVKCLFLLPTLFKANSHLKNITSLVGCHTQVVQGFLKIKMVNF